MKFCNFEFKNNNKYIANYKIPNQKYTSNKNFDFFVFWYFYFLLNIATETANYFFPSPKFPSHVYFSRRLQNGVQCKLYENLCCRLLLDYRLGYPYFFRYISNKYSKYGCLHLPKDFDHRGKIRYRQATSTIT